MIYFQKQIDLDLFFMKIALEEAKKGFDKQEVPVGAVLVKENNLITKAHNCTEEFHDATAHAEMLCLKAASSQLGNWRLLDTTLYVTLEPCSMCLGALLLARVKRVVWGAKDKRHGACGSWVNLLELKHPTHSLEIESGIMEEECSLLLKEFFKLRRIENDDRKRSK
jgi:tRNA(adenine34) deaminase